MKNFCVVFLFVTRSLALTPPQLPGSVNKRFTSSSTKNSAIAIPLSDQDVLIPTATNDDTELFQKVSSLSPEDRWVAELDYQNFGKEVAQLGKTILQEEAGESVTHLKKIVDWRNICALVGIATVWMTPNPVTILALSTWTYASWTMIAHHTCHGGYNRVDAQGFNSRGFALGSVAQRAKDWLDWMKPEAWNIEHNRLHHYRLNEEEDPDLVQRNVGFLRDAKMPTVFKYTNAVILTAIWKWFYYAPNTYKELRVRDWTSSGKALPPGFVPADSITVTSWLFPKTESEKVLAQIISPLDFIVNVVGPFFIGRFVLLPLPLLAIPGVGSTLFTNAVINSVAAELLTNVHSFGTIVTNHAGKDLYTFDDAVKPRSSSFYVRQIVGSANYEYGTDPIDFWHGFLNYQIEHHVWPDLSMYQYQKAAPQLKAICDKYGVPYVKESVFERIHKTFDIMVGKTTMRRFPTQYEPSKDKVKTVTWKSDNGSIEGDDKL